MTVDSQPSQVTFGTQFRHDNFEFDPEYTPLNNGSFGATPKPVLRYKEQIYKEYIANPDVFIRYRLLTDIPKALDALAPYLGVEPEDTKSLVFVENATNGINLVLRSLPLKSGDLIIYSNTTYPACTKTILFMKEHIPGLEVTAIDITYPETSDQVVSAYEKAIDDGLKRFEESGEKNTERRIVVQFDTVSSQPGCLIPWKKVVELVHKKNKALAANPETSKTTVYSLIDSAHGIGLVKDYSLSKVQPDFLVTNLYKWFYSPAPSAVLYVNKKHHKDIQSLPVSHGFVSRHTPESDLTKDQWDNLLQNKFVYIGANDYSTYLSSTAAIDFLENTCGGLQRVIDYSYDIARKGAEIFRKGFDSELLTSGSTADGEDVSTAMVNIYIPGPTGPLIKKVDENGKEISVVDYDFAIFELIKSLYEKHKVGLTFAVDKNGRFSVRVCGSIYVGIEDFKKGLEALKIELVEYEKKYGTKKETK